MGKRHESADGLPVVEAATVYEWTCDACGIGNICRPMRVTLSEDEKRELREEHGVPEGVEGEFVAMPHVVECGHCGKKYAARDPDREPFDDE